MIKISFQKLRDIDILYGRLLSINGFQNTKLGYAFKRFTEKNTKHIFEDYNNELQDNRIDNALTDKNTGALLYNNMGTEFLYSPEGLKNVLKKNKEIDNLWKNKEFDIEPYICNDIKGIELSNEDKELLEGLLINKKTK